jgi:predicted negative regulator of RcsB-dependent stress response
MSKTQAGRRSSAVDEDPFIARTVEAGIWAREHSTLITLAVIALIVAVAAIVYYRNYTEKLEDRAATELTGIRQTVMSGNKALAAKDLETFLRKFGDTSSGQEGRLLLSQTYLEQGDAPKAIATAKPLSDNLDKPLGASAAFLVAAAYEASNQPKKAEETYLRIADNARMSFERRQALDDAARVRLDRGDTAGAAQLYERLVGMVPDSMPEHAIYQMRLAEVKAQAGKS